MSSAYRLRKFLNSSEAADWWENLTEEAIAPADLVLLFGDTGRDIYLNCTNIPGGKAYEVEEGKTVWLEVQARDYCRAMFPAHVAGAMNGEAVQTHVVGSGMAPTKISEDLIPDNSSARLFKDLDWVVTLDFENCHPLFKPTDIESLAAQTNSRKSRAGISRSNSQDSEKDAEIERLRQELEQERAARKAEAKLEKPLHAKERQSVSQIIAALAEMAKLDLSKPYKAGETLRAAAAASGIELSISSETMVKFLKIDN